MPKLSTRRIKIFHLISGDLWAGAEVMASNLLSSLKDFSNLDIQVLLLNEGRLADELRASGLAVYVIDERRHSFWAIFRKARAIIGNYRPDIIHAHRYKENVLAFLIAKSLRRIQLIATQHGLPEISGTYPSLASRCKSKANFYMLSRYFDKTVAVSNDIRSTLINLFGFAEQSVEVIHNGIQLPPAPSVVKEDTRPFVIGSSGRLFPVKDYPLMIEIARALVRTNNVDIRFEIAGDGPEYPTLAAMIQSYGLQDHFNLRGHQDEMDSFYRGLSLYLNTSVHEGIPMTILEAMAHGLPIIAPAVGGIREIFTDGTEGFLLTGRNPLHFANTCLLLHGDKELRVRMSRTARKRVELAFSAEKMAESYYRLYLQAIKANITGYKVENQL